MIKMFTVLKRIISSGKDGYGDPAKTALFAHPAACRLCKEIMIATTM